MGVAAGTGCAATLRCFRLAVAAESLALFLVPKGRPLLRFTGNGFSAGATVLTTAAVAVGAEVLALSDTSQGGTERSGSEVVTSGSVFTLCVTSDCSLGVTVSGTDVFEPSGTPATLRRLSLHPLSTVLKVDVAPDDPADPALDGRPHSALSELRRRLAGSSQGGDPCGPAYGRSKSLHLCGVPSGLLIPKSPSLTPFTVGGGYTPDEGGGAEIPPLVLSPPHKVELSALGSTVR